MPVDFDILDRNTGGHSSAGYLATIIDIERIYQLQTGVGRNPGVQVSAHNRTPVVHGDDIKADEAPGTAERTQVDEGVLFVCSADLPF